MVDLFDLKATEPNFRMHPARNDLLTKTAAFRLRTNVVDRRMTVTTGNRDQQNPNLNHELSFGVI